MLNEGWDVLNLFDIVRLYDIRDGKTPKTGFVAGKTTNTEKQLIGRGARYYPFVIGINDEEKYTAFSAGRRCKSRKDYRRQYLHDDS